MNLIDLLPEKDKKLMEKYIHLYGINEKNFIGLNEYLKPWAESKKKLYKLLGNNFQLEIPYSYEKPESIMRNHFYNFLEEQSFTAKFMQFLRKNPYDLDSDTINTLWSFTSSNIYIQDKTSKTIKFISKESGKEVRLPMGMKPIRALQKIVLSFPEELPISLFEEFRIKHSLCLNDKYIKGTLVLSIHPFDFITMSDNDSDWSSCMSWMDEGCYHIGTVEMMNSNNVICAYVKSSKPFVFDKTRDLEWNNKKWRQLIYVTKDIIMSGKAYPYSSKDLSFKIIKELKNLAEENLSWTYSFGPEKYSDMIHINSNNSMDRNREWLKNNQSTKHNIIFDTKGMYNDMLNDNHTDYWCYRNKVKKMRIISVSGKTPCACCGGPTLYKSSYHEDYNDRWENPERIICPECFDEGECYSCSSFKGKNSLIRFNLEGQNVGLCLNCAKERLVKCPCCGKFFDKRNYICSRPGLRLEEKIYYNDYDHFESHYYMHEKFVRKVVRPASEMKVIPAFMCSKCAEKDVFNNKKGIFKIKKLPKNKELSWFWGPDEKEKIVSKKVYTEQEILEDPFLSKLLYANLEHYKEGDNLD